MSDEIGIGSIGNFYGGLVVKVVDNKFYWGIEEYNDVDWQEIPKSLYDELIKFEKGSKK